MKRCENCTTTHKVFPIIRPVRLGVIGVLPYALYFATGWMGENGFPLRIIIYCCVQKYSIEDVSVAASRNNLEGS